MRAIGVHTLGESPGLLDLPPREPGLGELQVRVATSSVNGFDLAALGGWLQAYLEYRYPIVAGKDFAGTVEAVGPGVSGFAVGDRVFGTVPPFVGTDGAFADHLTVGQDYGVATAPEGLDLADAGALGLAGAAALAAVTAVGLEAGRSILVSGASGGVGAIALQYAAAAGMRTFATARPGEEAEFVLGLGADEVIDYTGDVAAQVRAVAPDGVDAVLHLAGDHASLLEVLAPGGRLASTLTVGPVDHPGAVSVVADSSRAVLDRLAADVVAGRLAVPVTRRYPLEDAPRALADFPQGTLGKFAVDVAPG